jgi:formylglycine-generating enzyme required for sulfatase activity
MDLVPGGVAVVGCSETDVDCPAFNRARRVEVSPFLMARFEVTEDQHADCVEAGSCAGGTRRSQYPISVASLEDARAYCKWRGQRLPTSVEWERAARGADGRLFPWGANRPTCELATYSSCAPSADHALRNAVSEVGSHPVGAGPYGTQDLAGNLPEWTECGDVGGVDCVAVIRGQLFADENGLRTYVGVVVERGDVVNFLQAGIRCAGDVRRGGR